MLSGIREPARLASSNDVGKMGQRLEPIIPPCSINIAVYDLLTGSIHRADKDLVSQAGRDSMGDAR